MTQHKDLKRRVRARMRKTGEAYTAARAQIIRKPRTGVAPRASAAAALATPTPPTQLAPSEFAAIAGMSDEKVKEKTGCTWERWVYALDRHKADELTHPELAKLIKEKYKVGSWWTQMVAVGYERIKGLRARGQGRDGSYRASKSKTFDVPVTRLFSAWADDAARRSWLNGSTPAVRSSKAPKAMRLGFDDGSIVVVSFAAKGRHRSVVALEHTKLADRAAAERVKSAWAARFDALADVLTRP